MEVHHHSQTSTAPDSHRGRKKWTHYFWEFIMLFLAVFCGFLAEYQLEHKIEKDREKQYMRSMLKDLEKDTVSINYAINGNTNLVREIDTLLILISKPENNNSYRKKLFFYSVKCLYWYFQVEFSELTLSQLKNSGGYRLISKIHVAEGIVEYALGIDACKNQLSEILRYFAQLDREATHIYNMSLAKRAYDWFDEDVGNILLPAEEIEKRIDEGNYLLTEAYQLLPSHYNDVLFYYSTLRTGNSVFQKQKQKAVSLIQLIRANYKIKD